MPKTALLVDTDMSTDVDDVGALYVAHVLQDRGEAELVAVVHNANLEAGVGAISSINHYFGRDEVPIGAYTGPIGTGDRGPHPYVDELAQAFPGPIHNASEVPSALRVYRSALASAAPRSVTIASIGFLTNLHALLLSAADDVSPLSGAELVARKVARLVVMGGRYPTVSAGEMEMGPNGLRRVRRPEWNFGGCGVSNECPWGIEPAWRHYDALGATSAAAFAAWPRSVPIVLMGAELGELVFTGAVLTDGRPSDDPCRFAYISEGALAIMLSSLFGMGLFAFAIVPCLKLWKRIRRRRERLLEIDRVFGFL